MSRKYFGTDGIRGRVGEGPISADFVLRLGNAYGHALARNAWRNPLVIIGKDTRISNYMFEAALEAGLVAAGVDVQLMGPMPTPAVAHLTHSLRADGGIVISASHNPHYDNGELRLHLRGAIDAMFDVETFNGQIDNCFGPEPQRAREFAPGSELRFKEGDGSALVRVKTLNGGVEICKK